MQLLNGNPLIVKLMERGVSFDQPTIISNTINLILHNDFPHDLQSSVKIEISNLTRCDQIRIICTIQTLNWVNKWLLK